MRLKRNIINQESYLGFFAGDRRVKKDEYDNGYCSILGIDAKIKFFKNYIFSYEGVYSNTKESEDSNIFYGIGIKFKKFTDKFDGERFSGYANMLDFSCVFKYLNFSLYYKENSPTFRSDIGYIRKNNAKTIGASIAPVFYLNKFLISTISLNFDYNRQENFEKMFKSEWYGGFYNINFLFAQTNLGMSYSKIPNENIFNIYYLKYSKFKDSEWKSFWINSTPFKFLSLGFLDAEGDAIFYELDKIVYQRYLSFYNFFNFTKLQISFSFQKQIFYDNKNKFLEAEVFSLRTNYSFT